MQVTFELFGVLERLAGASVLQMNLSAMNATVEDALEELALRVPGLSEHLSRTACAVGDTLVLRKDRLEAGTHLALLPPVAGG